MKIFNAVTRGSSLRDVDMVYWPLNILFSYAYKENYNNLIKTIKQTRYEIMLDSGAYTVWTKGKEINVYDYIEFIRAVSPKPTYIVTLDKIGDGEISIENALLMKKELQMDNLIPVFHIGDDMEILKEYCNKFNIVGLSCMFGESEKESLIWLDKCFENCWPHKFHSFGFIKRSVIFRYPFYSGDSSSWMRKATNGVWPRYGMARVSMEGSCYYSCVADLKYFYDLQQQVTAYWRKTIERLGWNTNQMVRQTTQCFKEEILS